MFVQRRWRAASGQSQSQGRGQRQAILVVAGLVGCGLGLGGCSSEPADPVEAITSVPLKPPAAHTGPMFQSLAVEATGIAFENRFDWNHEHKNLYMHGYAGGGVCIGDYDDDGRPDVFLVSQTGVDRLYRQVGDFQFEDVTDTAGLSTQATWGTGATFADVDGDGLLDLYVCNYAAPNFLYLNQGDGTFIESAKMAGLDFSGASVMAGFADADRDGDLDLYLLTNRLYPGPVEDQARTRQVNGRVEIEPGLEESFAIQERVIHGETQKFVIKAGQRDRFYRNNGDGTFTESSAQAGITGNHPGLSATWWDYNRDGWPDLYVCNDFWDPDRLYRNNGDGTFTDVADTALPHTPWFSMGSDAADVDNDGLSDLVAADMSATTHYMSKIMMGDMNDSRWFLESAEPRQYMRNALYLNTGTDRFMEVSALAGVASTDWTWSTRFGDLDNDGWTDLFVTNGTSNHSFDPDLTRRLSELAATQNRRGERDPAVRWEEQWAVYREQPPRRERNLVYRNAGDLQFEEMGDAWGLGFVGLSYGAAYADLDRDGDLDLVVNNVEDPASIYRNGSVDGHRLLVRLRGRGQNPYAIGATVTIEAGDAQQVRSLTPMGGYLSADEPIIHVGLGDARRVDQLTIEWPSGRVQQFHNLAADRFYTITEPAGPTPAVTPSQAASTMFTEAADAAGLKTQALREVPHDDFARQPLLPARLSLPGAGVACGDVNGDGLDDIFIGAPAMFAGDLFLRHGNSFVRAEGGPWKQDRIHEDTAALFIDVDSDDDLDLYVGSGSIETELGGNVLRDRLYLNDGTGGFTRADAAALPPIDQSTSTAIAADIDRDGDLDLFVGARSVPGAYPIAPESAVLRNDDGNFTDITDTIAPGLKSAGMVTAALWSDANGDGWIDLLVCYDWGPVAYWENENGRLVERTGAAGLDERLGWWNSIAGADVDHDGDIDYIVMNAGLNTKYSASADKPSSLFYGDFSGDGRNTLVEASHGDDIMLPTRGRSCSSGAMPFIAEKLPTYHDFAIASLTDIYGRASLETAVRLDVTCLESGVLINEGTSGGTPRFRFDPLPRLAQASPGYGVVAADVDGDGHTDLVVGQNCSGREPETGRWNGGVGLLLKGDGTGQFTATPPTTSGLVIPGDARGAALCDINSDARPDVVMTQISDGSLVFANQPGEADGGFFAVRLDGPPGNPAGVGARVTVRMAGLPMQTAEIYAGSGYASQSTASLFFACPAGDESVDIVVRWPDGHSTTKTIDHPARQTVVTIGPAD